MAFQKESFQRLDAFLREEYTQAKVYPEKQNIFRVFQDVELSQIRVVILGQDPYHGEHQAIGRAFAVPNELTRKPPSLKNIFKEMQSDLGIPSRKFPSDLAEWAKQGVFLLNTLLTVRANQPFSHRNQGWEEFTDEVLRVLNHQHRPIVFLLWGAAAQSKKALLSNPLHPIFESAHPSPLSAYRGFLGSKPFSKINQVFEKSGLGPPIDWER